MERLLEDWQHDYRAIPWEYPISDNNRPATYDQFITLRDTLIFSNKYYADKAWRSLIIWTKLDGTPTDTIEIWEPNSVRLDFQPGWVVVPTINWKYIEVGWQSWITCMIKKDGRYKINHKEQFDNIDSSITRIHTYVIQHHADTSLPNTPRAVFDWERNTPWEIRRLTSFGYVECDLQKWDRLELRLEDQNWNDITSETAVDSNWRLVEYIDLAYNI